MTDDEKRIYVVVAETVDTPNGVVAQPCGRAAAQACHAVGKMQVNRRIYRARTETKPGSNVTLVNLDDMPFVETTTIILAARDSKELEHVNFLLSNRGIERHTFSDVNDEVYGHNVRVMTAICTVPVSANEVYGILDYLPLWSHGKCV